MNWLFPESEGDMDLASVQRALTDLIEQKEALEIKLSTAEQKLAIVAGGLHGQTLLERMVEMQAAERALRDKVEAQEEELVLLRSRLASACRVFELEKDITRVLRGFSRARGSVFPEPVVIGGPPASGKRSLVRMLCETFPTHFETVTSHTTRQPNPNETDGQDHFFVSSEEFAEMEASGQFAAAISRFGGDRYGIAKAEIEKIQTTGKVCVIVLSKVSGVAQMSRLALNAMCIWIAPPSLAVLEQRIKTMGGTAKQIQERIDLATEEMKLAEQPGLFDRVVVNDNVDNAFTKLKQILAAYPHLAPLMN